MPTMKKVGNVYIARSAVVEGDVELGQDTNIWHHCAIRGDVAPVSVGKRVNIQESSILHVDYDVPLEIGDDVLVGHCAVLHCRSVCSGTMIGIRASVLDRCKIGKDCIIAAGAVVTPDTEIPDGSVVMGIPGKVVRRIRDEERQYIHRVLKTYVKLAQQYADGKYPPYANKTPEQDKTK